MQSVLTKRQRRKLGPKVYTENGETYRIIANVRHDDECGNGHNSFSVTGDIERKQGTRWVEDSGGCIHGEVVKHFPELAHLIKWHLSSTDGPMHYVANTVYWAEQGSYDNARSSAVWPDATDEELTAPNLKERLEERLPALLADFRADVEAFGMEW
tara:strand:- start:59 stop:526 length:468 start_codon:yes stop_codon:yes gene_type:complete